MKSNNEFLARSKRINQEQRVYRFSRMQLLFCGIFWIIIQGGVTFWKSLHIVIGIVLAIAFCGLTYYLADKFERNMKIHPTVKWLLAAFLYVIGFWFHIKNN